MKKQAKNTLGLAGMLWNELITTVTGGYFRNINKPVLRAWDKKQMKDVLSFPWLAAVS